jgi:hypothetical protein
MFSFFLLGLAACFLFGDLRSGDIFPGPAVTLFDGALPSAESTEAFDPEIGVVAEQPGPFSGC